MVSSGATTVDDYLAELPEDRRDVVATVRHCILENLPDGYEETMSWGMICYEVPLERSGPTYNGQPLLYASLASQKRHLSLYLTAVYCDPDRARRLEEQFVAAGRKPDMGKSCVRFRSLDDLPLDVIAAVIAEQDVDDFVRLHQQSRQR